MEKCEQLSLMYLIQSSHSFSKDPPTFKIPNQKGVYCPALQANMQVGMFSSCSNGQMLRFDPFNSSEIRYVSGSWKNIYLYQTITAISLSRLILQIVIYRTIH